MTQLIESLGAARAYRRGRTSYIAAALTALFNRVQGWAERRRMRAHLYRMPDYMLSDIGVSRAEVENEWSKPFWKP